MLMNASEFGTRFLQRFLIGMDYEVALPVEAPQFAELHAWLQSRSAELDNAETVLQRRAQALFAEPGPILIDEDVLCLCVAQYQILFTFHSSVARAAISKRRLTELSDDICRLLQRVDVPTLRPTILRNHLIVEPFFHSFRRDTSVRFAHGAKRFFGEAVRLRWLSRWRRYTEEESGFDLALRVFDAEMAPAMRMLLSRSPLSRWLSTHRLFGQFRLETQEPVLEDRDACRLVCNHLLETGVDFCLPTLGQLCNTINANTGSRDSRMAFARLLLNFAASYAYWEPQPHFDELFSTARRRSLYLPPSQQLRFAAADEENSISNLQNEQRLVSLRRAWAAIALLLEQAERWELPNWDRQSPHVERLRQALADCAALRANIDEMREPVRALMS